MTTPRSRRLRRAIGAAVLAAPLIVVPVLAPATAVAADYGYGHSSGPWDVPPWSWAGDPASSATATATQAATAAESTGVVLIDTVIDYGEGAAAGTGLVLTSNGIVVTNHHVVQGSTSIKVTVPGGHTYRARVIGYDATHDVAVLQLHGASGLKTVTTDRAAATTGEDVTAVGNAEGGGTLVAADGQVVKPSTAITVSGDDGSSRRLRQLIQVSADIVSGDSGGALLDDAGDVIGMNVAASSGTAQVEGYDIPIDTVLDIAGEILAGDTSSRLTLGYAGALGVQLYGNQPLVAGVVSGGAAERAGLGPGSTITALDGTPVSTASQLIRAMAGRHAGERVTVSWTDQAGGHHTATVRLGRAPVA